MKHTIISINDDLFINRTRISGSILLTNIVDNDPFIQNINLPFITSKKQLKLIIEYLNDSTQITMDSLCKEEYYDVLTLLSYADYLDIQNLIHLLTNYIASLIRYKSMDKVYETLN